MLLIIGWLPISRNLLLGWGLLLSVQKLVMSILRSLLLEFLVVRKGRSLLWDLGLLLRVLNLVWRELLLSRTALIHLIASL